MDLNQVSAEEMQTAWENRKLAEAEIVEGLTSKKNVLLQSNPGMGRTTMAKDAAEKAGLSVVEFDTMNDFNLGPNAPIKGLEKEITARLENLNGTAILVNMTTGNNIDAYINVAKEKNLPLIASVSHNRNFEPTLDIDMFDNVEDIKPVVDTMQTVKEVDINERILKSLGKFRGHYVIAPKINPNMK